MTKTFLLLTAALHFTLNTFSQSASSEFGKYSQQELDLKTCSFDTDADAIILLDEAYADYDDKYQLITRRRVRIKILNSRGAHHANIIIPFYSKDNFEHIQKLEGISYNAGGQQPISYLDKKSIYTEKVNDRYSRMRFALPNVKEGSIVEYRFESVMKHYGGLDEWFFQSELPTLKSTYLLQTIPNAEFRYVLTKKQEYPVVIKNIETEGRVYFEMNNIPGLRLEPFMDAPRDYLQKVEFQLSMMRSFTGHKEKMNTTWAEIGRSCYMDDNIGGTLKKTLAAPPELLVAVNAATTPESKVAAVYNYVANTYTWNGFDSKFATESLKKIVEKKAGTSGELNLILLNYLESIGIGAKPLLVADRNFGNILPANPLLDRFNKTVAYVTLPTGNIVLDASEKYGTPGITPYSLLNTFALPVVKTNAELIEIGSRNEAYKSSATLHAKLDKTGMLTGVATVTSLEYAKQMHLIKIKENQQKYVSKLIEPYEGLKIDSFAFEFPEKHTDPLVEKFQFKVEANQSGNLLLLNYNLFTGLAKNPFNAQHRFTNINFGYPFQVTVEQVIELPGNAKVETLPANKTVKDSESNVSVTRTISRTGNKLTINLQFNQVITLVPSEAYFELKELYKKMVDMLNEPIVVKLGE